MEGAGDLMRPFPWKLTGAEVTISGNLVTAAAHGLRIEIRMEPMLEEALWRRLGVSPKTVAVTLQGDMASVELERRGIRVTIGPYSVSRRLWPAWWRELESAEVAIQEREKEVEYA